MVDGGAIAGCLDIQRLYNIVNTIIKIGGRNDCLILTYG